MCSEADKQSAKMQYQRYPNVDIGWEQWLLLECLQNWRSMCHGGNAITGPDSFM